MTTIGISALRSIRRHGPRNGNHLVLQRRPEHHLALAANRIHHARRVRVVRHVEHRRFRPSATIPARNQGEDAGGAGPGVFRADAGPRRLRPAPGALLLQTVSVEAAR